MCGRGALFQGCRLGRKLFFIAGLGFCVFSLLGQMQVSVIILSFINFIRYFITTFLPWFLYLVLAFCLIACIMGMGLRLFLFT